MVAYNFKDIEAKWQKIWNDSKLYEANIDGVNSKKFYNLWMFPYPSGEGLHVGHAYASTGSDIYGRMMRMQGYEVFQPIGYDSFGIHSENFAMKIGEKPQTMLDRTTKNYEKQMRGLGHGYDWSRTVTTSNVEYYRWTQWLFLQMWKSGLAYRKSAPVNWCPSCMTVLSDEQVVTPGAAGKWPSKYKSLEEIPDGLRVCERCGSEPEIKDLEQWFFGITKYAQRLLDNLPKIDWPEKIKTAQRNWIGRSDGMMIRFEKVGGGHIEVFTTRPDTLYGVTFLALASKSLGKLENTKEKLGVDTGERVINPINGKEIPVWEVNYVEATYGTGAVMGVPACDKRDFEFAKKYKLEVMDIDIDESHWDTVEKNNWGKRETHYHLRDWLISRQRYWGPPIPMMYCESCAGKGQGERGDMPGWYAETESNLPIVLPDIDDYKPKGDGRGPLSLHPEFFECRCPKCGGKARRETDVSDTFLDSAWYFLRYPSVGSKNSEKMPFDPEVTRNWLPVDLYFGGAEHAVLHLMYARFVTMVLFDAGLVSFEEPFPRFFAHGLMIKDGAKMSKSRGNVVNPEVYINKYGCDAFRLYLMFIGPMDGSPDFRDSGMEGMSRWMKRVWGLFQNVSDQNVANDRELNLLVDGVSRDMMGFKYNTAIAKMMKFVNECESKGGMNRREAECFVKILAPFTPHFAEEIWEKMGMTGTICKQQWPVSADSESNLSLFTVIVQVNGRLRGKIELNANESQDDALGKAMKIDRVSHEIGNKESRVVYVPKKVINIVTK